MEQSTNAFSALLGFWMFLQLGLAIVLILGGIYFLYCLGRAAAGLDRLAGAVESLVEDKLNKETLYHPPAATTETADVGPPLAPTNSTSAVQSEEIA